jgi:hypothetical protein
MVLGGKTMSEKQRMMYFIGIASWGFVKVYWISCGHAMKGLL